MIARNEDTTATIAFEVNDVTGRRRLDVGDIQPSAPAGAVAAALAERMALPSNIPWMLRDASSRPLTDDRPIGEQIEAAGARLTVTPKAHLG